MGLTAEHQGGRDVEDGWALIRRIPTLKSTGSAVYIDHTSSSRTTLTRWLAAMDGPPERVHLVYEG